VAFILAANVARRHLSKGQAAMAVARARGWPGRRWWEDGWGGQGRGVAAGLPFGPCPNEAGARALDRRRRR
jgi:hypothetical protein